MLVFSDLRVARLYYTF